MPKAYWIAHVTVTDPEPYKLYAEGASEAFREFGARVLARGGPAQQMEGEGHPRNVVIEFDSMEDALACYHSDTYQNARKHREGRSVAQITFVEGV
ncbi:DUF1330 domain-containing protein [Paracoccus aurantiacus]|uniref:DUF1330 domain-containing protein n=1 Tax=Paracoccus aurantiacus TaxID=2599412 RepID=A0A5C6S1B2_9RHOB|nr:DUF1330 domain-containing protein [Paracoccus aurantiacus]TXB68153.1 DUF1330 domain-containing protein [Paracoccus aurantiacus]